MKTLKKLSGGIIFCIIEALIGILLLINPVGFTSGIIISFGVIFIVWGVISIIQYFRQSPEEAALSQGLMKGLVLLSAGLFSTFKSGWFLTVFPLMTIFYGIAILLSGFSKVQWAIDLLRKKASKWFLILISAIVSIICSVVVLSSPFTSTAILWMFTGISLIIESVFDIVALIMNRRIQKEAANAVDNSDETTD